MPLSQDKMGRFWCRPKSGGKLPAEPAPVSAAALLAFIQNNECPTYRLSVAAQLPLQPRALRGFKKIAVKINIVVILSTAGWGVRRAALNREALLRHVPYLRGISSLISILRSLPLSARDT